MSKLKKTSLEPLMAVFIMMSGFFLTLFLDVLLGVVHGLTESKLYAVCIDERNFSLMFSGILLVLTLVALSVVIIDYNKRA